MEAFDLIMRRTYLFKALKAIPPTSVKAERAFLAVGLFLTKLRSSLDDSNIDTLCFTCQKKQDCTTLAKKNA